MSVDRSLRSTFAALLLIAALFVAMNRVVSSAPLADWGLPLALFIIGAALLPDWNFSRSRGGADDEEAEEETPTLPTGARTYRITAQQVTKPHTMTIRPDPESSEYTVVNISEDTPGNTMPFMDLEVAGNAPSVPLAAPPAAPAPAPHFTAHTEAAEPDVVVAKTEAPVAPAPDTSVTATPREPESEVIVEKTAAPQQPYEAEQVGAITPEQVDKVISGAPDAEAPLVTETASPSITAQERDGEGVVASADDLVKLNGIGPKSAAALKAAGIDSFQKLANSSEEQIRAAVAGVRLVGDVTTWAQQAAYAARGDWAGLNEFNAAHKKSATGD